MEDGAKNDFERSAFDEAIPPQIEQGPIQTNQASDPAKKKKKRKVALPKIVEQGYDDNGNTIEIIQQRYWYQDYTPPPSESDDYQSATDNEAADAPNPGTVAPGLRRSGRHRSNKLKKANMKNDKLVSNALQKAGLGDITEDEEVDVQDDDVDEDFQG